MKSSGPPRRAAGRSPRHRAGALLLGSALVLPGCFATQKHVELVEADLTKQAAWNDERFQRLEDGLEAVRSETEVLRTRMDDLADQLVQLGDEVSARLAELERSDREVAEEARRAARSTEDLEEQRRRDREDLLKRMNAILDEIVRENERLAARIEKLESSALTFGRVHRVRPGESVASIAARYGVSPEAIVEVNQLEDADRIQVGQELVIPGAGP